jgi:hypothetical protein
MHTRTKKFLVIAGFVSAALWLAGYVTVNHLTAWWPEHPHDQPFDRSVWLANTGRCEEGNPRGHMVAALTRQFAAGRPTREEVRALLGAPDMTEHPDLFSYHIGEWTGFHWDCDSFDVRFDSAGRVTSSGIVQH